MSILTLTERRLARTSEPAIPLSAGFVDEKPKQTFSDALSIIVAYVPTEVIGAYTLVIATVGDGKDTQPMPMWSFWLFLAITPLLVWLLYAVRCVEQRKGLPWRGSQLPYWEAMSAMIAFTVWSATLPRSAFRTYVWYEPDIAAVVLVVVSLVLPLVGTLVTRKKQI